MTKAQDLLKKIAESTATTYDYIFSLQKKPEDDKNDVGTVVNKSPDDKSDD